MVVAIGVFDIVIVTEFDCVNVFGNEVGIGDCETEVVIVIDSVGVCDTVFVLGKDVANGDGLFDTVFIEDTQPVPVTV